MDNFRFWDYPVTMPEDVIPATNIYDMRLTAHEDGWIYGIFCAERHDEDVYKRQMGRALKQRFLLSMHPNFATFLYCRAKMKN